MKLKLTQKKVKELFDYHKDGHLTWKVSLSNRIKIGSIAGSFDSKYGYYVIRINKYKYLTHRIIFLWHHGYLPELVDHDDRFKTHNWIDNLREVSPQCSVRNRNIMSSNKSGITGVMFISCRNKWRSYIKINRKTIHIGNFDDVEEAIAHRLAVEQCLDWNGCNSTSSAYLYMKDAHGVDLKPSKQITKELVDG